MGLIYFHYNLILSPEGRGEFKYLDPILKWKNEVVKLLILEGVSNRIPDGFQIRSPEYAPWE